MDHSHGSPALKRIFDEAFEGILVTDTQAHIIERLVEDHWATIQLGEAAAAEIRQLVWEQVERLLPERKAERERAVARIATGQRESDKLMQAYYADAIPLDHLKREQARIAASRAAAEQVLAQVELAESTLRAKLEHACALLATAQVQYLTRNCQILWMG